MRRRKLLPPAFLLLLLLSFLREGTSQTSTIPSTGYYVTEVNTDILGATEDSGTTTEDYITEVYTIIEDYTTETPGTITEDYITEVYTITEDYTTETPGTTTEDYITEVYTITEDYTTETPGTTTEDYITEVYTITEDYTTETPGTTTEEYTTEAPAITTTTESPKTAVKPDGLLKPWAIILISLAAAAVLIGLSVGLGFFLNKILHQRSPFSAAIFHPHDSNFGLHHGLSGLHHRWGWKKPTASSTMGIDERHSMPSAC